MNLRTVIVVPCFNEADRLDADTFLKYVIGRPGIGFLFVDDGSRDGTIGVINRVATESDRIAVFRLERNSGKAEAVRRGVLRALESRPERVGYWDADLATPLSAITDFEAVLAEDENVELAMGARVQLLGRNIQRRALRHYFGRVFATAASLKLGLPVYDTQCGAKVFRVTSRTALLFSSPFMSRWIFDVEVIARLIALRANDGMADHGVTEIPLRIWKDVQGSKVRARDGALAFLDLVRMQTKYPRHSLDAAQVT